MRWRHLKNGAVQVSAAHIHSGADAHLIGTSIHDAHVGVHVATGATARVHKCDVLATRNSCVVARGGATCHVSDCKLAGSLKAHGLEAEGAGSHIEASNSRLLNNAETGAYATSGATFVADACSTEGNRFSACTVKELSLIHI